MEINNNDKSINITKDTIKSKQPQILDISPNEKKKNSLVRKELFIGVGAFLVLLILTFSTYLLVNLKKPHNQTKQSRPNLITNETQEEKIPTTRIYKLEEIFKPEEKISSSQIAPNGIYTFIVTKKTTPIWHVFKENENGPIISVDNDLIFVNLITGERKTFNLYDITSKEIIEPLKTIPVKTQFRLYVNLLKWSADNNDFWGAINLVSNADPPVNDSVSLFKINVSGLTVAKYPLPGNYINTLRQQNLNLDKNAVLFESATPENELYLYNYNILTKNKTIIVSYPNSVFSKYLPGGYLGYYHPWFSRTESRQLNPKWLDKDTILYIDFVTRQEVTKRLE